MSYLIFQLEQPSLSMLLCPSGEIGLPGNSVSKESTCNAGDLGSIPELGRSLGEGKWQPTPVFLPEKSHGQRSLVGSSSFLGESQELDKT